MRLILLPLALLALVPPSWANNAPWSDTTLLADDTWHGLQLRKLGPVAGVDLVGSTLVAKSVMTGRDSFFPNSLPSTLKVLHRVPDSTHPKLAFWYTPDVFVRDNVGDGARISEWPNVANICHDKHDERVRLAPNGVGFNDLCTTAKVANSQAVRGGNNVHVAKLGQASVPNQPIYKKSIVNGHGVVRFSRGDIYGSSGQFLEMTQRCTDYTCTAASNTAGWGADSTLGFGNTTRGITAFMVVKTAQSTTDVNPMGIMHFNENGANKQGAAIYATETRCIPDHYGVFPVGPQNSATAPFLFFGTPGVESNPASQPAPSAQAGRYNGMTLKIYAGTADTETTLQPLSNVCTITQYLITSFTVSVVAVSATTVTVKGGAGTLGGITLTNAMFLRIGGTALVGTGGQTIAITGPGVANGVNTDIPVAGGVNGTFPMGTPVFLCQSATVCTIFKATCQDWNPATNALVAGASTAIASGPFEIRSRAVTGAPNCPDGKVWQFSTFTGYVNSNGRDDGGDNACFTECGNNGGCSLRMSDFGAGNTCLNKQGTARQILDTNREFRVLAVTISADRTAMKAYVNGFHEGCDFTKGIDGCAGGKITPLVKVTGGTAQTYSLLRFGALAAASLAPTANFASMDVAEIMLYQDVLTPEELDRVGLYLADKFQITGYVVNDDERSPFRTKPVQRSAGGCGPARRKVHNAVACKGQSSCAHDNDGTTTNGKLRHNVISLSAGDADLSDDYYLLMRLTITGGRSNAAGTVLSASGQSCVITAYTAAGALATCDLTRSFEFGYVVYGTESAVPYWNKASTNAVETTSTDLFVSWVPSDRVVPFVALLGDMGTPGAAAVGGALREAVWVTAMAKQTSGLFKLTVTRAVGGTAVQAVTNANALAKDATARLNYPRAVVLSASAAGHTWLVVSSLAKYVTLPTPVGMANWYARISTPATGAHEVVQVTQANAITFVVITATVAVGAPATFDLQEVSSAYRYQFSLMAGDKIRFGTAASGEQVTLLADIAVSVGGGNESQWTGLTANVVTGGWVVGTVVTLLERKALPTPAAIKVVRALEGTTAVATNNTLGTPIDFMFLPQGGSLTFASTYSLDECHTSAPPFDSDASIQISRSGSGSKLMIQGWYLMPVDQSINWAVNSAVGRYDVDRLQNYLRVTVGSWPSACGDPTLISSQCVTVSGNSGETELNCQITETGSGHCANDWTTSCRCVNAACADCTGNAVCNVFSTFPTSVTNYYATRYFFAPTKMPAISCVVPSALGSRLNSQNLNIYWHGIRSTSRIQIRRRTDGDEVEEEEDLEVDGEIRRSGDDVEDYEEEDNEEAAKNSESSSSSTE